MPRAMGEALREGQAGGSRAGRTQAWDEVRPEGPSTCRSETCPAACLRLGGPQKLEENFEPPQLLRPWTPRPLPGQEKACLPWSRNGPPGPLATLSPATWWSLRGTAGPELESLSPAPMGVLSPGLRINPSPALILCPISVFAAA